MEENVILMKNCGLYFVALWQRFGTSGPLKGINFSLVFLEIEQF